MTILRAGLILLLWALTVEAPLAHQPARPDLDAYFDALRSDQGLCCSGRDGTTIQDPDWESNGGRYRVRIDGHWYDVPDDAVVKSPNLFGPAVAWPRPGPKGLTIRCFLPGAGA